MQNIIAREDSLESLRRHFDDVLMGHMGLSIIVGDAGVGKSYLVENSIDFFINNKAKFIKAKSTPYAKEPLVPIINIMNSVVDYIYSLPQLAFELIKKNYMTTLQEDGEVLCFLCPRISEIIDKRIEGKMHHRSTNEIVKSICNFIRVSAKILFPLVIFIDDIQWCDATSLKVILELINKNDCNIHLILTYREHEGQHVTCELEKNDRFIQSHIYLKAFDKSQVKVYLKELFGNSFKNLNDITDLLYSLTLGKPFYIDFLINRLLDRNLIKKDQGERMWFDLFGVRSIDIPKDIEQILLSHLDQVSYIGMDILNHIAVYGGAIDLNILSLLIHDKDLGKKLDRLCEHMILIKTSSGYMFVHDIIYQIIYQRISKDKRQAIQLHIINTLVKHNALEKGMLIASLITKVDRQLLLNHLTTKYIDIIYTEALNAFRMSEFLKALSLFKICEYLLTHTDTPIDRLQHLEIELSYMECEFVSENEDEARKRYNTLKDNFPDHILAIKRRYINFYSYSANWEMVLSLGEDILESLGFRLSKSTMVFDLLKCRALYTKKSIKKLMQTQTIKDERVLNILEVLTIMFPAANRIDIKKFTQITVKLALLTGQYGRSKFACIGYAACSYILYFVFGDHETGDFLQKMTLELLDHDDVDLQKSIAYALIGTFTYHWSNPFHKTLDILQKSIDKSEEENEYLYSNYAIVFSMISRYVMGQPLPELRQYIATCQDKKKRLENYLTRHMYEVFVTHIDYLRKGQGSYHENFDEDKQSFQDTIVLNYEMLKCHQFYLEGRMDEGYAFVDRIESQVWEHHGFILNGDFAFYSALTRIAVYPKLSSPEKARNKKIIWKHLKWMLTWAEGQNLSQQVRYLLMKAEYDRCFYKNSSMETACYDAMILAKQDGNVQLEALANLIAARQSAYNVKLSQFYAKEAIRLYKEWGAVYIASHIAKQMGVEEENTYPKEDNLQNNEVVYGQSLQYIHRLRSMTDKEAYQSFFDYLANYDGIIKCAMIMEKDGEMYLKYSRDKDGEFMEYQEPIHINYIDNLPQKVIHYVARTDERVMIVDDSIDAFKYDAYLMGLDRIVMCMPLKYRGVSTGIMYIESNNRLDKNLDGIIHEFVSTVFSSRLVPERSYNIKNTIELTKRETQILELVSTGMSNEEISQKVYITVGTVRNHLSKIYTKLEVSNRVQAIVQAKKRKLIS